MSILAPSPAPAADDPIMVFVHFHPTPGREDELKARLVECTFRVSRAGGTRPHDTVRPARSNYARGKC